LLVWGKTRGAYRVLVGKPAGERPLARHAWMEGYVVNINCRYESVKLIEH
jgi:hypothetical protein